MSVPRVRYREGQRLLAQDMRDEQAYLLALARRHKTSMHRAGIVGGLVMTVNAEADALEISEGLAIDGYGRQLVLDSPQTIPWEMRTDDGAVVQLFDCAGSAGGSSGTRRLGVWLEFRSTLEADHDSRSCGPGRESRWAERPAVVFTPWVPDDPRSEASMVLLGGIVEDASGVRAVDVEQCRAYAGLVANSVASFSKMTISELAEAPSPVRPAPVPHSRIDLMRRMGGERRRFAIATADEKGVVVDRLTVDHDGVSTITGSVRLAERTVETDARPRSELVLGGDHFSEDDITDPSGLICQLLNPTDVVSGHIRRLLTVIAARPTYLGPEPEERRLPAAGALEWKRRLADVLNMLVDWEERISKDEALARVNLRQDTWALVQDEWPSRRPARENKLVLADVFSRHVSLSPSKRSGARALEFRPVRPLADTKPWSIHRTVVEQEGRPPLRQLRVGMDAPVAGAGLDANRVQVGLKGADGAFKSCLMVDAAGTVTVRGNLVIHKRLIEAPVEPDPNDPRFLEQLANDTIAGQAAGLAALSTLEVSADLTQVVRDANWAYYVTVKNTGTAAVTTVGVYETVALDEQVGPPVLLNDGELVDIGPGASEEIAVEHEPVPQGVTRVSIALTAIGAGPAQPMYASRIQSAPVVAPPV